ncbi:hypothetical protein [Streptomyces yanii]|uniref:Uncharacterized protein n=1 Tax=Streptomyces yanii TaxID=78510 RepID=A0ABV5R1Q5_9ACTN
MTACEPLATEVHDHDLTVSHPLLAGIEDITRFSSAVVAGRRQHKRSREDDEHGTLRENRSTT